MEWPEDISSDLPAPRPDEPPTLRSDILDELADHLQSSLEHEQIKGKDKETARKSVLSRFGNPSTIACQLWWDAMWGKIMRTRLKTMSTVVFTVGVLLFSSIIWKSSSRAEETVAQLVDKVSRLTTKLREAEIENGVKYLEWTPLNFHFVNEEGKSLCGEEYQLHLTGAGLYDVDLSDKNAYNLFESTDESGTASFGWVRPGFIGASVKALYHESGDQDLVVIKAGERGDFQIVCPEQVNPIERTVVLNKPKYLNDQNFWYSIKLFERPVEVDGRRWTSRQDKNELMSNWGNIVIDPAGNIHIEKRDTPSDAAEAQMSKQKIKELNALIRATVLNSNEEQNSQLPKPAFISIDASHPKTKLSIPSGQYEIWSMSFLKDSGTDEAGRKKLEVIATIDCKKYGLELEESMNPAKPDFELNIPDEFVKMLSNRK